VGVRGTPRSFRGLRPSMAVCAALRGTSWMATHINVCFGRRRRLRIAIGDSVVRGIDRVDLSFTLSPRLPNNTKRATVGRRVLVDPPLSEFVVFRLRDPQCGGVQT
jgi:hypothetical protein